MRLHDTSLDAKWWTSLANSVLLVVAINILLQSVPSHSLPVAVADSPRWSGSAHNVHGSWFTNHPGLGGHFGAIQFTPFRSPRAQQHPHQPQLRGKRSGISDQRLAELVELARMEMIRKLFRDHSRDDLAYGLIDPAVIGRRRRRRDLHQ